MSDVKPPADDEDAGGVQHVLRGDAQVDIDTRELLKLAALLGARDRFILNQIIRRAGEICEQHGPEVALAVLDQIEAILRGRKTDA